MAHHSDYFGTNLYVKQETVKMFLWEVSPRSLHYFTNIAFKKIFEKFKQFFYSLFFVRKIWKKIILTHHNGVYNIHFFH